ncbi:cystathionine gamma-synthase [Alteribacter lacisalsi]|uniref:homocysteine desulfhydrase n=1 Tax=Alteribacter lacisalsi TaxID=2045244 RepID=A0A2W0HWV7_9BACI|nr:cystathionine gamma-synthase family protein [Alteribacter lacisalsi]PYZ98218.1 cystathionine gamma-synthase [Alteribacter lacisalsi]
MKKRRTGLSTRSLWAGEREYLAFGATQVPVVHSVSFGYNDMDEWYDVATGKKEGHIYGRNTNPTVRAFEEKIRILEDAEASTSFSTGMAAISNTLATFLRPGSRVVSIKDTYGGTNKIFTSFLPDQDVEVTLCDTGDHEQMIREIKKGCDLVYMETPTNPTVKITNVRRIATEAKKAGVRTVVDNTFATPINQNPLSLGADLVIHSATKYLGGHADALGGAVCGSREDVEKIYHYREINGATMDPMAAYLLLRGMKTLKLRIDRQNDNAQAVAEYLKTVPEVEAVFYPGLTEHEGHQTAREQMRGFGGMLSFSVTGGVPAVQKLLPNLEFANRAANLGAVETVVGPTRTTSHVECTPEERAAMGIPESLIRYSAGIEDAEDLIEDLKQAFAAMKQ